MDFLMDIGEVEVTRVVVEEEMEATDSEEDLEEGETVLEGEDGVPRLIIDSARTVKEVPSPRVGREDFTSAGTVVGMSGGRSVVLVGDRVREELRKNAGKIVGLEEELRKKEEQIRGLKEELERKDERIRDLEVTLKQSEMREKEEGNRLIGRNAGLLGDLEKAKEEIAKLRAQVEMFAKQQLRKMEEKTFSLETSQPPGKNIVSSEPVPMPTGDGEDVEVKDMKVPAKVIPVSSKKKRVSFSDSRSDAGCDKENSSISSRLKSEVQKDAITIRKRHGAKTDLSNPVTLLKGNSENEDIRYKDELLDALGREDYSLITEQIAIQALLCLKIRPAQGNQQRRRVDDAGIEVHGHSSQFSGTIPAHGLIGTCGESTWLCHCGQRFTRESSLKDHVNLKMGLNMQQCQYCAKAFPRQDYLKVHILNEHNYAKKPAGGKGKRSGKRKRSA